MFSVERCVNSTKNGNHCHNPDEIDNFIEDIFVDYWAIEYNIDLSKFK